MFTLKILRIVSHKRIVSRNSIVFLDSKNSHSQSSCLKIALKFEMIIFCAIIFRIFLLRMMLADLSGVTLQLTKTM